MTARQAYEQLARTPKCTPLLVNALLDQGHSIESIARRLAEPKPGSSPSESFLTPACEQYPTLLRELRDRPLRLFHRGRPLSQLSPHCVAVVGSRKASSYGLSWSRRLGAALAQNQISVCSGLALGIDAAAHRGALEVVMKDPQGAPPVGVLGHGWDHSYPVQNRLLRQKIEDHGIILSEYEPDVPPSRWSFPARNRIIAGMCQTVVVVEAGQKSGSLHTARFANEAGRDVWVVPNRPGTLNSQGTLNLLRDGATPMLNIEDFVRQLLDQLSLTFPRAVSLPSLSTNLLAVIVELAQHESGRPNERCSSLNGSPPQALASQLSELELMGLVERRFDGTWALNCWEILPQLLEDGTHSPLHGAA